jgi:hypothetical protein
MSRNSFSYSDAPSQYIHGMSDSRNINHEDLPSIQISPCVDGAKPKKFKPRRIGNESTINDSK